MYNVRRKLWILTVLLFAVSAVMLKFFPSSDNNDAIATPANAKPKAVHQPYFQTAARNVLSHTEDIQTMRPKTVFRHLSLPVKSAFGVSKRIFAKQATVNSSVCTMTRLTEQQTVRELFPTTRLTI